MNFLITMGGHDYISQMATNFLQQKEEELEIIKDTPHAGIYEDSVRLFNKGMALREFQHHVNSLVSDYHRIMDDDDLIEAIANGTIDSDLDSIIKLVQSIEDVYDWGHVLSIIPVDWNGTIGAVITHKSK